MLVIYLVARYVARCRPYEDNVYFEDVKRELAKVWHACSSMMKCHDSKQY